MLKNYNQQINLIFEQECIPVRYLPPAAVAVCWDPLHPPPGVGLEAPSQVWAWRPPGQIPPTSPPQMWAWRPPWPDLPTSPLGVGLKIITPCGQTPPTSPWVWAWRPPRPPNLPPGCRTGDPPPVNKMTERQV